MLFLKKDTLISFHTSGDLCEIGVFTVPEPIFDAAVMSYISAVFHKSLMSYITASNFSVQ